MDRHLAAAEAADSNSDDDDDGGDDDDNNGDGGRCNRFPSVMQFHMPCLFVLKSTYHGTVLRLHKRDCQSRQKLCPVCCYVNAVVSM